MTLKKQSDIIARFFLEKKKVFRKLRKVDSITIELKHSLLQLS